MTRKYELSMCADYVPEWGVKEAVREFFQNAIDEENRDSSNKMFFDYSQETEKIMIGNKHSDLDIKTLLFGMTAKNSDKSMIGNHGEGYKIATVVLMRLGKTVLFRNYCRKEIWRPEIVVSKKYGGVPVPVFTVETVPFWDEPEHSLIIEISGITEEEYTEIKESNLHLQDADNAIETAYGRILEDKKYIGNIYVSGLFVCNQPELDIGIDFRPDYVRLERDRSMVNGFDVKWYAARMIEESKDAGLIKKSLDSYSGAFIDSSNIPEGLADEIAEDFINCHSAKAVPVSSQNDMDSMKKRGYKPVIVSEAKKNIIIKSSYYADITEALEKEKKQMLPLYERFCKFAEEIEKRLEEKEVLVLYSFADEIERLGATDE